MQSSERKRIQTKETEEERQNEKRMKNAEQEIVNGIKANLKKGNPDGIHIILALDLA